MTSRTVSVIGTGAKRLKCQCRFPVTGIDHAFVVDEVVTTVGADVLQAVLETAELFQAIGVSGPLRRIQRKLAFDILRQIGHDAAG